MFRRGVGGVLRCLGSWWICRAVRMERRRVGVRAGARRRQTRPPVVLVTVVGNLLLGGRGWAGCDRQRVGRLAS